MNNSDQNKNICINNCITKYCSKYIRTSFDSLYILYEYMLNDIYDVHSGMFTVTGGNDGFVDLVKAKFKEVVSTAMRRIGLMIIAPPSLGKSLLIKYLPFVRDGDEKLKQVDQGILKHADTDLFIKRTPYAYTEYDKICDVTFDGMLGNEKVCIVSNHLGDWFTLYDRVFVSADIWRVIQCIKFRICRWKIRHENYTSITKARLACENVENYARSLGRKCEHLFSSAIINILMTKIHSIAMEKEMIFSDIIQKHEDELCAFIGSFTFFLANVLNSVTRCSCLILAASGSGKSTFVKKKNFSWLVDGDNLLTDIYKKAKYHFWEDKIECKKIEHECDVFMDKYVPSSNDVIFANYIPEVKERNYRIIVVTIPYEIHSERVRSRTNMSQPTNFEQITQNRIDLLNFADASIKKGYNVLSLTSVMDF